MEEVYASLDRSSVRIEAFFLTTNWVRVRLLPRTEAIPGRCQGGGAVSSEIRIMNMIIGLTVNLLTPGTRWVGGVACGRRMRPAERESEIPL